MGPSRLHALIDGVFAIAVTLLVLDLPKPQDAGHVTHDLLHAWPSYVAYAVLFLTVAIVWIEHHGMMSAVTSVNRRFLERTLLLLFFVSAIPWPTALAADYARGGGDNARDMAILYAATMLLMGLAFALSWRYLAEHQDLVAEPARPAMAGGAKRSVLGALAYVPAIVAAFVSPIASFALAGLVAVYFAASRSEVPGLLVRAERAAARPGP